MKTGLFNKDITFLVLISIIFLSFILPNIAIPGIDSDEAMDGLRALYLLNDKLPQTEHLQYTVKFLNREFPIMSKQLLVQNKSYTGVIPTYLLVPFLILLGPTVFSLRILPVFIALAAMFFIYHLCKDWFGKKPAQITLLLTATNLAYVLYSKIGLYRQELFQIFFLWMGLFIIWLYLKKKKPFYLSLAFFIFGLGLSAKIMFLWYILGMISVFLAFRKEITSAITLKTSQFFILMISFLTGGFFIILYNIKTKGGTLLLMYYSIVYGTSNADNKDFLNNLLLRTRQLFALLKGNLAEKTYWIRPESKYNDYLTLFIFLFSFIFLLFLIFFNKNLDKKIKDKIAALYIFYTIVFVAACFTISTLDGAHLFILFPFPQLIIALAFYYLITLFKKQKFLKLIAYTAISCSVLFNIMLINYYHANIRKSCGYGSWSLAIYDLAGYLHEKEISKCYAIGRGLQSSIPFLTKGKTLIQGIFYNIPAVKDNTDGILKQNPSFYIITTEEHTNKYDFFKYISQKYGKNIKLEKSFLNRAGRVAFCLYKIY